MKMNAYVIGVGMTQFGKHVNTHLKDLTGMAVTLALKDAGIESRALQAAWMGNAAGGVVTGQEMIRGQVALRTLGIGRIPVVNVENACASGSTAFHQASAMVSAGLYDLVIACGSEKLFHEDKSKSLGAFTSAVDVEDPEGAVRILRNIAAAAGDIYEEHGVGANRSVFMDLYSMWAKAHMKKYGTTREQFAMVSVKNSVNGSLNERAQFRDVLTVEQVLAAREIVYPLTLPMCSPIGDGAAAVIIASEKKVRELGIRAPIRIASSTLASGWDYVDAHDNIVAEVARQAYENAAVGPEDLSCVELHDASAPSEIMLYEYLGLCLPGEGGRLVESGITALNGRIPVNTSGGLLRKGHPIGATGCAQIVELTEQLQGRAGKRQVKNARVGLAENGGGAIGTDSAATVVTILKNGRA